MKLSEVLKEREAQLEMKSLLTTLNKEEDNEYLKRLEEETKQKDAKEAELYRLKCEQIAKITEYNKKM